MQLKFSENVTNVCTSAKKPLETVTQDLMLQVGASDITELQIALHCNNCNAHL